MANSKRKSTARKLDGRIGPERRKAVGLDPDFPLFCHRNGRWAKKVRGKIVYFGKIAEDPKGESALGLWRKTIPAWRIARPFESGDQCVTWTVGCRPQVSTKIRLARHLQIECPHQSQIGIFVRM